MKTNILVNFYENSKMIQALNSRLYNGTMFINKCFSWDWNLIFQKDIIKIKIRYDEYGSLISGSYVIEISIKDIKVYDGEWLHKIPKEMIEYINSILKEINIYNKLCNKNEITKSYNEMLKVKKLEEYQKSIQKHEDEKRRLLDIFKI